MMKTVGLSTVSLAREDSIGIVKAAGIAKWKTLWSTSKPKRGIPNTTLTDHYLNDPYPTAYSYQLRTSRSSNVNRLADHSGA